MKRILPWLLVPVAAWLGHRSAPAPDSPSALPPPPPEKSPIAKEASALAGTDPAALLQHAAGILAAPDGREKRDRLRLVCARWAELDPAAGLAWAAEQDGNLARQLHLWILLEWTLLDSAAAWAAIPEGEKGDSDRQAVTGMLLHENPGIFMDWFRRVKQPMPNGSPSWLRIVERHAAELEEIAMARLQELEKPQDFVNFDVHPLFSLLARHRAEKDPVAAFDWAAGLPASVRVGALNAVLGTWAEADPLTTWKKLTSLPKELSGAAGRSHGDNSIGAKIIAQIGKDDPAAALQLILDANQNSVIFDLGGIKGTQTFISAALARGDIEPLEAYRLLSQATGRNSNLLLNVFPKIWFGLPPDTLVNAARDILNEPPAHDRETALGGIAAALFARDPQAAADFISTIEDEGVRRSLFAGGFRDAIGSNVDPQTQARWLALVPEKDRASLVAGLMSPYGVPRAGSTSATAFPSPGASQIDFLTPILRDLPPSPDLTRAVEIAAIVRAASSPAESLAWADSFDDPAARKAAYAGTFDTWAYHDPVSAATWLVEREPGPERDAATLPLVRRLGDSDPESGWAWAAAIGDPVLQNEARLATMKAWSKQSPEDAQAALQDHLSTLPPAEAAAFTQSLSAE